MVDISTKSKTETNIEAAPNLNVNGPTVDAASLQAELGRRNPSIEVAKAERGYVSPNPGAIPVGGSADIRTNDAQAEAVKQWILEARRERAAGGSGGAIVFTDLNGTKYGLHHAGEPAPRGTHYNISCFNEHSDGLKFGVSVGINNPLDPNTTITISKLK